MIEGAVRYYQEGLEPSPTVKTATAEYFEENDTIQQWLDDSAEIGPDFRVKGDVAYANYRAWAGDQGIRFPLIRAKFTGKLKAKGIACKTGTIKGEVNPVRCYFGIKIVIERSAPF
ncbi:hypothetical protein [Novosphingobium malaysiense]|uniref:hypothetical protein n=1 Tax=Novosphingobium malaysiense TaxID=1348853 RepID=UPI0012E09BD1|nr:hypothetical protein [Novosphingobium malaysiense]